MNTNPDHLTARSDEAPTVQSPDSTAFWRDSVYPEGMTAEQVKAELDDFHFLMGEVPKVYMAVTGGLLSKPNYHASTVIAAFEDYLSQRIEEELAEARAVEAGSEQARSNVPESGSAELRAAIRREAVQACIAIAEANGEDEPYGHAKFRCANIAAALRALLEEPNA